MKINQEIKRKAGRHAKYPFAQMEIGDSFIWSGYTDREMQKVCSAFSAFWARRGDKTKKCKVKKVGDDIELTRIF